MLRGGKGGNETAIRPSVSQPKVTLRPGKERIHPPLLRQSSLWRNPEEVRGNTPDRN